MRVIHFCSFGQCDRLGSLRKGRLFELPFRFNVVNEVSDKFFITVETYSSGPLLEPAFFIYFIIHQFGARYVSFIVFLIL